MMMILFLKYFRFFPYVGKLLDVLCIMDYRRWISNWQLAISNEQLAMNN